MKLVPMRFMGVQWHHNPKEISFECEKDVKEIKVPFGNSYIQNLGRKNMRIRGTGELYGKDCLEQFDSLLMLFRRGGQGVLAIPKITPVFAVFESIKIIGEPKPDMLTYSFVFREIMEKKYEAPPVRCIADKDDTLWDISYRYGISIDTLVTLNKWIRRPDISLEGKSVKLC